MSDGKIKIFKKITISTLIGIWLFLSVSIPTKQQGVGSVFDAMVHLRYDDASRTIAAMPDNDLRLQLSTLTNLLTREQEIDSIPHVDGYSELQRSVFHLSKGYHAFFGENINSLMAYQDFSKALGLANSLENPSLIKFCLKSILEVLRKEIFIGSKQFRPYLNHFQELISSQDDEIVLAFFEVVFASKENQSLEVALNYADVMKKLDGYFLELSDEHPYMPFYLYEKGVQSKLDKNYENAISYYQETLKLCNRPHLENLKSVLFWQLSHTFLMMDDLENAKDFLTQSEITSVGLKSKFYDQRLKAWILKAEHKYDSAYHHLYNSIRTEYRMGAKNNSLETALLSVENETDKLKLDKLQLDNQRKKNRNYLITVMGFFVIGTLIAVLVHKNTVKKRKLAEQDALLEQQKVETLLKEQELVTIDAMIEGQEKERQKVANELHDDLGSLMATVKLHFDKVGGDKEDSALKSAQELLEEAYQKIRGMAHSKNSGVMSDQGLLPAIQKMAQTIERTNSLHVAVEDFGMGERLENSLELTLFRMVQELVANSLKHSKASKVNIQLTQHKDNLNIIVEDNGRGFDVATLDRERSGMGLTSIEKRVEHLEGSFTVDSVLGRGTSILIDIPL